MALLILSHPARQFYHVESLLPLRGTVKATLLRKVTGPTRYIRTLPSFRVEYFLCNCVLTLILRRSRTGTVWFYTSTSNKRAARPKLYTKSLTGDLKLMYSRFTLVRISINL